MHALQPVDWCGWTWKTRYAGISIDPARLSCKTGSGSLSCSAPSLWQGIIVLASSSGRMYGASPDRHDMVRLRRNCSDTLSMLTKSHEQMSPSTNHIFQCAFVVLPYTGSDERMKLAKFSFPLYMMASSRFLPPATNCVANHSVKLSTLRSD